MTLIPFKVPHPLLPVIAQLVDIHHASVPHYVSRVDKVAWEDIISNQGCFSYQSKVGRRCSCSFQAGLHQLSSSWSLWSGNWVETVNQQYLLIFVVLEFLFCEFSIFMQSIQLVLLDGRENGRWDEGSLRRLYPEPSSYSFLRRSWILLNQSAHLCWCQSYWRPKTGKVNWHAWNPLTRLI